MRFRNDKSWISLAILALLLAACQGELNTGSPEMVTTPDVEDDIVEKPAEKPKFEGEIPSMDQCQDAAIEPGPALGRRLTNWEYAYTIQDVLGVDAKAEVESTLTDDLRTEGFTNTSTTLIVNLDSVNGYESLAATVVDQMDVMTLVPEASRCNEFEAACQEAFTREAGKKLFRRPLDDEEVATYQSIFDAVQDEGDGFDVAASLVTEAMLQSPQFLYRLEAQEEQMRQLDGYEIASRLSYLIWTSAPDGELIRAAEAGELETEDGIETQVRRMLADPKSNRSVERYMRDWLALDKLDDFARDAELFPEYSPALGRAMQAETLAVAEKVLRDEGRPLSDLFRARETRVSRELAEFYGFENPQDGVATYDLTGNEKRAGILTHAGVLASSGGGSEPSLVQRGLFILNNIMCRSVDAPSLDINVEFMPSEPGKTQRFYSEERLDKVNCAGCHAQFDPLGYGLEQFDGVGLPMTHDLAGNELSTDGHFFEFKEKVEKDYNDVSQYMNLLAESPTVQDCLVKKPVQYALGRALVESDACLLSDVKSRYLEEGATYDDLMVAIATNPNFRHIEAREGDQ